MCSPIHPYLDREVRLAGTVASTGADGFVLRAKGRSIYVGAPHATTLGIETGEEVDVRGEIARISRYRSARIAATFTGRRAARTSGLPTDRGEPFLRLRALVDG